MVARLCSPMHAESYTLLNMEEFHLPIRFRLEGPMQIFVHFNKSCCILEMHRCLS